MSRTIHKALPVLSKTKADIPKTPLYPYYGFPLLLASNLLLNLKPTFYDWIINYLWFFFIKIDQFNPLLPKVFIDVPYLHSVTWPSSLFLVVPIIRSQHLNNSTPKRLQSLPLNYEFKWCIEQMLYWIKA